ncbi:4-hydroxy-3-methylbut-2-enyl diphosphate reductase, partial [Streptomyces sp. T-3]|nr:4-hydroxy-3-methylbut-2-enyl diphosphate reductase [Streptomyces sp. T-3]
IEDADAIEPAWIAGADTIGLTAGASAPPFLADGVLALLRRLGPVRVVERTTTVEDVQFAPPSTVRNP